MANPSFVGAGTFTSGTGALSVPWPAGYADGDLAVLVCNSANQAITTGFGGTEVANVGTGTAGAAGGVSLYVEFKIISGGTQSNVSVSDSGSYTAAQIFVLRNVDPDLYLYYGIATTDDTATSTITCPGLDYADWLYGVYPAGSLVLHLVGLDKDATQTNTITGTLTNSALSSITKRADSVTVSGVGGGIACITGVLTSDLATSMPNTTSTADSSTTHAYVTYLFTANTGRMLATIGHPSAYYGTSGAEAVASAEATTLETPILLEGAAEGVADVFAHLDFGWPDASWGVSASPMVSADLTTDPYEYVGTAVAEAFAEAPYINSSFVALSDACVAGVTCTEQASISNVAFGFVSADTVGNTSLLCGAPHKYLGDIAGDEIDVRATDYAKLVFADGTLTGELFTLPSMPWATARAAGGRLFVLNGWKTGTSSGIGFSWVVSTIRGYIPNNTDASTTQAGNFFQFTMPFAARWTDIAYGNGIWLAVAGPEVDTTQTRYATSTDGGQTWTTRTFSDATPGTHCVFINGYFVRPGYKSTDGVTWTAGSAPAAPYRVSGGVVFTDTHYSSDGLTWTAHPVAGIGHNVAYLNGRHGGMWLYSQLSKLIDPATAYGYLYYSTNGGASWSTIDRSPYGYTARVGGGALFANGEYAVTCSYDYAYLDVYAGGFYIYPYWWSGYVDNAASGDTWCQGRAAASLNFIEPISGSAEAEATIITRNELIADATRDYSAVVLDRWKPLPTTPSFADIYVAGGKVLYVGSTATYVGGLLDAPATSVTPSALTKVRTLDIPTMPQYFVGWTGTTIYYSADGNTWTLAHTHSVTISKIVYVNGEYVAYSFTSAAAARSTDGISWTSVTLANSNCVTLHHCEDHYYFTCGSGTSYTLQVTTADSLTGGTTSIWSLTNLKLGGVWRGASDGYLYVQFITSSTEIYNYTYRALDVYDIFVQVIPTTDGTGGTPPGLAPYHDTGQGVLVAWGNATAKFYYSENGLNWTSGPTLGSSYVSLDSQGRVSPSGALLFNRGSNEIGEVRLSRYAKAWGLLTNYTEGATALRGKAVCADVVLSGEMNPDNRLGVSDNWRALASAEGSMFVTVQFQTVSVAGATVVADLTAPQEHFFDAAPYGQASSAADLTAPKYHYSEAAVVAVGSTYADLTVPQTVFFDATSFTVAAGSAELTTHPAIYLDALCHGEMSGLAALVTAVRASGSCLADAECLATLNTGIALRNLAGAVGFASGDLATAIALHASPAGLSSVDGRLTRESGDDSVSSVLLVHAVNVSRAQDTVVLRSSNR